MKKELIIVLSFSILFLVACSKEDTPVVDTNITHETDNKTGLLYAGMLNESSGQTKTIIDKDGNVLFEIGDEIWLRDSKHNPTIGKVVSVDANTGIATIEYNKDALDPTQTILALYPASAASQYGEGMNGIRFTIPMFQDGSFRKANISAAKGPGNKLLKFRNITSVIKVESKPEAINTFIVNKSKICGDFYVSFDESGNPLIDDSKYTWTNDQLYVGGRYEGMTPFAPDYSILSNLPAEGPYYISVSCVNQEFKTGDTLVKYVISAENHSDYNTKFRTFGAKCTKRDLKLERSVIYNVHAATMKGEKAFSYTSDNKLVDIAPGNLYYDSKNNSWDFESTQYETQPATGGQWNPDHVSHFYWCTNADDARAESYNCDISPSLNDILFTNDPNNLGKPNPDFTVNGQTGVWYTPSSFYSFSKDSRMVYRDKPYIISNLLNPYLVDGTAYYGIFFYPDLYKGNYDEHSWAEINEAGIIFLPETGYRKNPTVTYDNNQHYVEYIQNYIHFNNGYIPFVVMLNSEYILVPPQGSPRSEARSIRMIKDFE